MENLIAERTALAMAYTSFDTDMFPGSRGYGAMCAARRALSAFDAAHPEVLIEINRCHSDAVLGGRDVEGM